jgi:hypothetical protein
MGATKAGNIFESINYKIVRECNNIDEIYENIPFVDDNFEKYIEIKQAFPASVMPVSILVGGVVGVKDNIFKKINKNSKNISNLSIKNGDWENAIINKNMDELMHSIQFNKFSIHRYLNNFKIYNGIDQKDIIIGSNHKKKYIEAVFASDKAKHKRNPSRDCIIGLGFAFNLNLVEVNYLLKAAGYNELYLRNRRDLIIAKSILEGFCISKLNSYLLKYGEDKVGNLDDSESYTVLN